MTENNVAEKKEIIKKALNHGVLLTPNELDKTTTRNLAHFLKNKPPNTQHPHIWKTTHESTRAKLTTKDIINYKRTKYYSLRDVLLKKTNATSINKIKNTHAEITVIGLVKEVNVGGLVLEDPTGQIDVTIKPQYAKEEDVVAIKGTYRENRLLGSELIFPDIPINRKLEKIKTTLIFTPETTEKTTKAGADVVFALKSQTGSNIIKITTNPAKITFDDSINVLVYKPREETEPKESIQFLKKRHISPKDNEIKSKEDYLLIKDIPDIFWVISDNTWKGNYKGVCLFSCGKNQFAKINMETREINFADL